MPQLPFQHLRGATAWLRCDHHGTTVDAVTGAVRLASRSEGDPLPSPSPADVDTWLTRRGAALELPIAPDACLSGRAITFKEGSWLHLRHLVTGLWRIEAPPEALGSDSSTWSGAALFEGAVVAALADHPKARRFAVDSLEEWATWTLPAPVDGLCGTPVGVLAWSHVHPGLWLGARSSWPALPLAPGTRPISAVPTATGAWLLIRSDQGASLLELHDGTLLSTPIEAPAAAVELVLDGDDLLIGELEVRPTTRLLRWRRHRLVTDAAGVRSLVYVHRAQLTGYLDDAVGRAPIVGSRPLVLTSPSTRLNGPRTPLVPRLIQDAPEEYGFRGPPAGELSTEGRIETHQLDSQRYGCMWHRVFLDVCVPNGTRLMVEAKTSDSPLPDGYAAPLRPPAGYTLPIERKPHLWPPLGSISPDDPDGWEPLGALDVRPLHADRPFPVSPVAPSEDPLPRRPDPADGAANATWEGLLKNDGGRYLWLRIHLLGTTRATPRLIGVRVTYPRPSLLRYLPAFWRSDPVAAQGMDQLLSLFEGPLVELEGRVDQLPLLLRAATVPTDALDWLASFVGLTLDARLPEGVRRQLVFEMAGLHRQRGTVPGLERLLGILARATVRVIESWRMRHTTGAVLGVLPAIESDVPGAILGPGLQLGGDEASTAEEDPMTAFYRGYAHEFSVLVLAEQDDELAEILQTAIEAHKPAHTAHTLCWAGAGLRLGQNSLIGIGTVIGRSEQCPDPLLPILLDPPPVLSASFGPLGGLAPDRPTLLGGGPSPSLFQAGT